MLSLKGRKSISNFKKAYVHSAERLFKDAIKAFILAAVNATKLDTGMSRATYLALASKIRFRSAIVSSTIGSGTKHGHTSNYGFPVPNNVGPFKSRAFGARLGTQAYTLELGTISSPTFKFKFSLVTIQQIVHEAEVNSLVAGEQAFSDFIINNYNDYFPSIEQWLVNGRIV